MKEPGEEAAEGSMAIRNIQKEEEEEEEEKEEAGGGAMAMVENLEARRNTDRPTDRQTGT